MLKPSRQATGKGLVSLLSANPKIYVMPKSLDLLGGVEVAKMMSAIATSCKGPFSIDEGKQPNKVNEEWAQISWVCRTGEKEPVRQYFNFNNSPEINLEFHFANRKVESIFAAELLPIPGRRLLGMDAADSMDVQH